MALMQGLRTVLSGLALLALAGPASAEAVCTAYGQSYQPGEVACVPACHGQQRLARCDAVGDAASWTTISQSCPSARLTPLKPGNPARPVVLICTLMNDAPFAQIQ